MGRSRGEEGRSRDERAGRGISSIRGADSQRLNEDEEEDRPVSLRKRSFASSERVRELENLQRWWMGVADRERESVVVG